MAKSTISLDFKANTAKALAGFRSFSDDLTNKFLISGLKLDLMKDAIANINREFDNALGQQGLNSATELKQIESSAGAVFSVLKGGSLEAGREMAKNIRMALGDVSKSLGSTTEDINSVMKMIPVTSKSMLDAYGITMEDFASMNLRMITNARDAFGEDASKLIEGILSGQTDISTLNADQTGIGQLIRQRLPGQDFSAMSQEMRTSAVLRLLQDSEFQSQIEGIAEDNAGFMRTFRSFKNVLFDSRTGIFGMLKEVTVELRDFSGNKSTETTSIFKEINRLYKVLFSPEEGVFAALGKVIAEAFNLDGDSIAGILVKLVRFITNLINGIIPLIESDVFRGFVEIIKGIIDFFMHGINILSGINTSNNLFSNFTEKITGAIESFGNIITDILKNIQDYFNNLNFNGEDILIGFGDIIGVLSSVLSNIFIESFKVLGSFISSLSRNSGGWSNIAEKLKDITWSIIKGIMDAIDGVFAVLLSDEFDIGGFIEAAMSFINTFIQQLVLLINKFIANFKELKEKAFPNGFEEFGRQIGAIIKQIIPPLIELFAELITPLRETLRGFFEELLDGIVPDSMKEELSNFLADFIIMTDQGGIISKIMGALPGFGGALEKIYAFMTNVTDVVSAFTGGGAANVGRNYFQGGGSSGGGSGGSGGNGGGGGGGASNFLWGTLGTIATLQLGMKLTGDWLDTMGEISEGNIEPENAIGELIKNIRNIFYSGNIPNEVKTAANGMNIFNKAIDTERANTRPGIKPVIANSDEIIIPPGRLAEVQITSANQINTTLMNFFAQMMRIFNPFRALSSTISPNIPPSNMSGGMGGSKALTGDFLNIFFSDLEKDTEDVWTESKDKNTDFYKELERDIETKWRPSLNRINQSLNNLEVPSLSLPSLVVPDISIPEIKSEDINIEGDWTEVVGEGWDRVKNFFDNAGQSAEELTQGPIKSIYDNLKKASNWFESLFPGNNNNNNIDDGYMGDMTPITNAYNGISQAISLEKSMTSPGTGIIIANQNEIVAPPNRLLELTDNLLARSNVNKNNSTRENINNNTFNIEINASNISNPRELANEIRKALNEEYSKYAATVLIPNT